MFMCKLAIASLALAPVTALLTAEAPVWAPVHVMLITRREILVWKKTCNEWLAPRQTGTIEMMAICNTDWSLTNPSHKVAVLYIFAINW